MSVLKPCLLCEGEAKLLRRSGRAGIACPSKWYRERVECKVCGLTTREYKRPGSAFRSWNKRPRPTPARCDELVTIGAAYLGKFFPRKNKAMWPDGAHEIVTRQNAEEVIAAERLKLESTAKVGLRLSKQVEALEADNTAKDARIAELENYAREATKVITSLSGGGSENFNNPIGDVYPADLPYCLDRIRQRYIPKVKLKHLEADNKRLRDALGTLLELNDSGPFGGDIYDRVDRAWGNARAALGDVKP